MALEFCEHCNTGFRTGGKSHNRKRFDKHVRECLSEQAFSEQERIYQQDSMDRYDNAYGILIDAGFDNNQAEALLELFNREDEYDTRD